MSNMQIPFAVLTEKGFQDLGIITPEKAATDAFETVNREATYRTLNPARAKLNDYVEISSKNKAAVTKKASKLGAWIKGHKGISAAIAAGVVALGTVAGIFAKKAHDAKIDKPQNNEAQTEAKAFQA